MDKILQKILGFGTKEFVEKAIEGGWEEPYRCSDSFCNTDDAHLFLDPLAWQAVGKVEGWSGYGEHHHGTEEECVSSCFHMGGWQQNMHRMIDALIEEVV